MWVLFRTFGKLYSYIFCSQNILKFHCPSYYTHCFRFRRLNCNSLSSTYLGNLLETPHACFHRKNNACVKPFKMFKRFFFLNNFFELKTIRWIIYKPFSAPFLKLFGILSGSKGLRIILTLRRRWKLWFLITIHHCTQISD